MKILKTKKVYFKYIKWETKIIRTCKDPMIKKEKSFVGTIHIFIVG